MCSGRSGASLGPLVEAFAVVQGTFAVLVPRDSRLRALVLALVHTQVPVLVPVLPGLRPSRRCFQFAVCRRPRVTPSTVSSLPCLRSGPGQLSRQVRRTLWLPQLLRDLSRFLLPFIFSSTALLSFARRFPGILAQAATPYSAAALRATASRDPKPDPRHHLGPCARRVPRRVLPDPTTTPCVVARPSKTWSLLFALRASSSYDRSTSVEARDTRLKQAPRPFAARSTILRISPLAAKPPRRSESSLAVALAPSRLSRSPEPYLQISALPTPLDRLIRPTSGV
ncbi:hypothetical protein Purlil1_9486 [Purpureocillium lilacinum]|uniref:Uncharacterized protein n=1 Tax=Purpureocillium lilacinum TaxID=33203 RepID=A0ABR0BQ52_PURLI|nr:hypothetical protein Purlil1_9486 [Purpureocillium lilacinum]